MSELGDEMGVLNSAAASNSKDLTAVKAIQVHLQTEMDTFESKVGKVFQLNLGISTDMLYDFRANQRLIRIT